MYASFTYACFGFATAFLFTTFVSEKHLYLHLFISSFFLDQLALYISLVCVLLNNTVCKF